MRNDIPFFLTKLTVLALVAVLTGCGGGDGGGSGQNQSSPQTADKPDAGQAAKVPESPKATEKPAEKFTPELVKVAMEAALAKLPNLRPTKEERVRMMEPKTIQGLTDKLNKNISDGKVVDPSEGVVVDAITVEALAKSMVIAFPSMKKKAVVSKSTNNAKILCVSLQANSDENEGKFPAFDEWCDAILRDMNTLAAFISPQHPDAVKLMVSLPKLTKSPPVSDALPSPGKGDKAPPPPDQATSPKASPKTKAEYSCHYAFNKVMAGKIPGIGTNHETVLVFECDLGWNGAGGLGDALKYMDKLKLERIAVATADGAARTVTREELKKLKWEIAP